MAPFELLWYHDLPLAEILVPAFSSAQRFLPLVASPHLFLPLNPWILCVPQRPWEGRRASSVSSRKPFFSVHVISSRLCHAENGAFPRGLLRKHTTRLFPSFFMLLHDYVDISTFWVLPWKAEKYKCLFLTYVLSLLPPFIFMPPNKWDKLFSPISHQEFPQTLTYEKPPWFGGPDMALD